MSLAPSSHLSLYSSPPLSRTIQTKQTQLLLCQNNHFLFKKHSFLSASNCFSHTLSLKPSVLKVKASKTESQTSEQESGSEGGDGDQEQYEEYEVELVQPYGLKFVKGRDGGTYIDAIGQGGSADKTGKFTVGDKVLATRFSLLFFYIYFLISLMSLYLLSWIIKVRGYCINWQFNWIGILNWFAKCNCLLGDLVNTFSICFVYLWRIYLLLVFRIGTRCTLKFSNVKWEARHGRPPWLSLCGTKRWVILKGSGLGLVNHVQTRLGFDSTNYKLKVLQGLVKWVLLIILDKGSKTIN